MTKLSRQEIARRIREIAKEYGVDPELAVKVADCESGLNPRATNINKNGSVDRGLYQWNDRWHPEIADECAYNRYCSTRAFCRAVKNGHLDWWSATKRCWKKAYRRSLLIRIRDLLKKLLTLYRRFLKKRSLK